MPSRRQIVSCYDVHAIRSIGYNDYLWTYDGICINPSSLHPLQILPNNPEFKNLCLNIYFLTHKIPIITQSDIYMFDGNLGEPVPSTDVDEVRNILTKLANGECGRTRKVKK